ncbi:hypothetical protein KAR91_42670, partial [Candidatus Pacearchaeota archaeon]|nr:hypothetical protein [Candidatus Pacearchaeota archaeon]
MDDVWSWPPSEESFLEDEEGELDTSNQDSETSGDDNAEGESASGESENPLVPNETEGGEGDYECMPNDEYEDLFGEVPDDSEGIPENCNNRRIDEGEQCDDGNNEAGDGCSEACQLEESGSLMCIDIEAVTFKKHKNKEGGSGSGAGSGLGSDNDSQSNGEGEIPLNCPEGSTAANSSDVAEERAQNPPQYVNYNPNVPGAPKVFPAVDKSECPAGLTWTEVQLGPKVVGRCLDSDWLCANFEEARKTLFGEDYEVPSLDALEEAKKILEENNIPAGATEEAIRQIIEGESEEELSQEVVEAIVQYTKEEINERIVTIAIAKALEVSVCVDVKKINRPESPYPVTEGCIYCHILGMNDVMTKMLEKPVFPMENNMQAWGMSNRWGPTFSFNINTVVQSGLNTLSKPKYSYLTDKEKADLQAHMLLQDATNQLDPEADQPGTGVNAN